MESTQQNTTKGKALRRPLSKKKNQFGNLALRYYKGRKYKTALRAFRQEIQLTRGLLPSLEKIGYKPNQRILTPRMVQVIEEYLGEP